MAREKLFSSSEVAIKVRVANNETKQGEHLIKCLQALMGENVGPAERTGRETIMSDMSVNFWAVYRLKDVATAFEDFFGPEEATEGVAA